jgi:hypothetical protein
MPLAHRTLSHGLVAFGFFNVECDCLLLNHYFFFARDFCAWVREWADQGPPAEDAKLVFIIENPRDIGSRAMGEQGIRHHGFMSALYERFPFPDDPGGFRQQPEGDQVRPEAEAILRTYALEKAMTVRFDPAQETVTLGEFSFDQAGFRALLDYVWRGGMPTWRDGIRPRYVEDMSEAVRNSEFWPFAGMYPDG